MTERTMSNAAQMRDVRLTVNGRAYVGRCEPRMLLVDFLREELCLTGHGGDKNRRVPVASRGLCNRNISTGNLSGGVDHFPHRVSLAGTEI